MALVLRSNREICVGSNPTPRTPFTGVVRHRYRDALLRRWNPFHRRSSGCIRTPCYAGYLTGVAQLVEHEAFKIVATSESRVRVPPSVFWLQSQSCDYAVGILVAISELVLVV